MSFEFTRMGFAGFGPMGRLMAEHMTPPTADVMPFDPQVQNAVSERDLVMNDGVVFAVSARDFLPAIRAFKQNQWAEPEEWADPLIIDPMSVKQFPEWVIASEFPDHPEVLHCHPLFGPQSIADGVEGKTVIITEQRGEKAEAMVDFWQQQGLIIDRMTAKEHDELMAELQIVPFVLGRLASSQGLERVDDHLKTPSSRIAEALASLDRVHSEALFETIVGFNPASERILKDMQTAMHSVWRVQQRGILPLNGALHRAGVLELGSE